MAALSPRMGEVPDRMKTALLQFMGAIAPHCEEYFTHVMHTRTFLSRIAHIAEGTAGGKPSATLTVAARRLLELVYHTTPQVGNVALLDFIQYSSYSFKADYNGLIVSVLCVGCMRANCSIAFPATNLTKEIVRSISA